MGCTQEEMKKAVECGYWNLYRYDPRRAAEGKNPFQLDSPEPDTEKLMKFLEGENRYASLKNNLPDRAHALYEKTIALSEVSENVHNNYCRGVHGMVERNKKWYSGEVFQGVWYGNSEAARGHHMALNCVPSHYAAFVAFPLDVGHIEPDVVAFYISSSQAFMMFAAYQYEKYEKLDFTFTGESTCSDSWTRTFLTGKPSLALPCFADRKFSGIGEWELRVTVSPGDFPRILDGLAKLYKNGLRHPIAPSSLTTDMLEGLPATYLKY